MVIPPAAASIKIRVLPLRVLLTAGLGLRVIVSRMYLRTYVSTYILYMIHVDLEVYIALWEEGFSSLLLYILPTWIFIKLCINATAEITYQIQQ